MSREIKFRIWYHGQSMDYSNKDFAIAMGGKLINYDSNVEGFIPLTNRGFEYELMQFTGLKDKNGKEIYEGDIVKYIFHLKKGFKVMSNKYNFEKLDLPVIVTEEDEGVEERIALIYWAEGAAVFGLDVLSPFRGGDGDLSGKGELEVIGNMYENPNLLK